MSFFILFIGILISLSIRLFFALNSLDVADVLKAHQVAQVILQGQNPYQTLSFAIYPPLNYYLETITLFFSSISSVPFHVLTKIWPNLADLGISLLLYKFLLKKGIKPIPATIWTLVFLLNPISIIISSAHGQVDSIPSLFVLLSVYLLTFHSPKPFFWSGLLLGLGIAIKPNPLMLLPIFIVSIKSSLREKIIFLIVSIAPVAISTIPYLIQGNLNVLANLFNYSGVYDFGYSAILRGFWFQQNANIWMPMPSELVLAGKLLFLATLAFLSFLFWKSKNLIKGILSVYLLFLTVYFGISAQYLSWILPFAVLERSKIIIPFTLTGLFALFGFYMFFGPDILLGNLTTITAFQSKFMPIYVIGNLMFWITIIWWLSKIILQQLTFNKTPRV